jgi:hypothetical protein
MSAKFNVTIIQPPGYLHAQAMGEGWVYLADVLRRAGYDARASINEISPLEINVLVCGHLLNADMVASLPPNTIVFNSEKLEQSDAWYFTSGAYTGLIDRFTVWDYTARNLAFVPHHRKAQIPFYFTPALKKKHARVSAGPLMFYGCMTDYRRAILKGLEDAGVPIALLPFGCYGDARDKLIFQSMGVLNLHTDSERKVFEPVRCFHPLINGIPVITEEFHDEPMFDIYRRATFVVGHDPVAEIAALVAEPAAFEAHAALRTTLFAATDPVPDVRRAVEAYLGAQGSQSSAVA